MTVDRAGLWILMACCTLVGVLHALRAERRVARADSRLSRAGRYGGAVITGFGVGLIVSLVVLLVAVLMVHLR